MQGVREWQAEAEGLSVADRQRSRDEWLRSPGSKGAPEEPNGRGPLRLRERRERASIQTRSARLSVRQREALLAPIRRKRTMAAARHAESVRRQGVASAAEALGGFLRGIEARRQAE